MLVPTIVDNYTTFRGNFRVKMSQTLTATHNPPLYLYLYLITNT